MSEAECAYSPTVFGAIIHGFALNDDSEQAKTWLRSMQSWKLRPNEICYGSVMDSFARSADVCQALGLFHDMRENEISPSSVTVWDMRIHDHRSQHPTSTCPPEPPFLII